MDVRGLRKKDFWGFSNGEEKLFVRITCRTIKTMRALADRLSKLPQKVAHIPGMATPVRVLLYESNIDPLLRFFHVRDIRPCGWIRVRAGRYALGASVLPAKCAADWTCSWQDCMSESCDEIAPLLVASFDIECSSSHGDFPVAKKDYRRVAQELLALYTLEQLDDCKNDFKVKERIIDAMLAPFTRFLPPDILRDRPGIRELSDSGSMSTVYPKQERPDSAILLQCCRTAKKIVDDVHNLLRGRAPKLVSSPAQGPKGPAPQGRNTQPDASESKPTSTSTPSSPSTSTLSLLVETLTQAFSAHLPLQGDKVIQIGTTLHKYGSRDVCYRYICTLGTCEDIPDTVVNSCDTERQLLTTWSAAMNAMDPDIVVGWNIFGFDMEYIHDRGEELGCIEVICRSLSRLRDVRDPPPRQGGQRWLREQRLSSSALGDNFLRYIDMHGRTSIDLMKVVQRDHKLDSYKLDLVAHHFLGQNKHDVAPSEIFRLQNGTAADRRIIAEYCVQDCALCNHLTVKLEIVANNAGMANVCSVPLAFIFMRGQGVKIFSLVAKQCKLDGFLIPTVRCGEFVGDEEEEGYEGAIVLDPKPGIYLADPVSVLDYASLYPSSMISENLSHDCFVIDPRYDNLPGVEYLTVCYEEGARTVACRFAQIEGKGVLPRILMQLLKQRKATRKRMESSLVTHAGTTRQGFYDEASGVFNDVGTGEREVLPPGLPCVPAYNDFQKAVLDGLQLAYKVTANSLYGQMGARTSPLYLKQIAACTTATGRKMILMAKAFLEERYGANVVYGDTDSIFITFPKDVPLGRSGEVISERGKDAIMPSIRLAMRASKEFKACLKPPHDLEYEKTFWPWIIFSKKRYVGNLYEFDDKKYKQKSMGIALKRRDNAPIVKQIYGGCLDIVLSQQDIRASLRFLEASLQDLVEGKTRLEDLVVTKTLRAEYKNPDQIAHYVLARRMGERDPGNKPQINDRVPYVYIEPPANCKSKLQGDRIEHPEYVRTQKIRPDYRFYITNQIMKPVQQLYSLALEDLPLAAGAISDRRHAEFWQQERGRLMLTYAGDAEKVDDKIQALKEVEAKVALFDPVLRRIDNKKNKMSEITSFFHKM
jgi:DNA polymerase delta subunit 1